MNKEITIDGKLYRLVEEVEQGEKQEKAYTLADFDSRKFSVEIDSSGDGRLKYDGLMVGWLDGVSGDLVALESTQYVNSQHQLDWNKVGQKVLEDD
jgi:hypothetical protein